MQKIDNPEQFIGCWRRFGPWGPVYQVVGLGQRLPDGDCLMHICVFESGEELDYKLTHIMDDPEALRTA
jgi:Family of unknown function (DUF5397)